MEDELQRHVSLGEVFLKTHKKPDGTFVDQKVQTIAEAYRKNLQTKLFLVGTQASQCSDGTSRLQNLSIDEENQLFLQSIFLNERGVDYGVGSLSQSHFNRKKKYPRSSSAFNSLQKQLEQAQRQIEEQVAENARCEAELTRVSTALQEKIGQLS